MDRATRGSFAKVTKTACGHGDGSDYNSDDDDSDSETEPVHCTYILYETEEYSRQCKLQSER